MLRYAAFMPAPMLIYFFVESLIDAHAYLRCHYAADARQLSLSPLLLLLPTLTPPPLRFIRQIRYKATVITLILI